MWMCRNCTASTNETPQVCPACGAPATVNVKPPENAPPPAAEGEPLEKEWVRTVSTIRTRAGAVNDEPDFLWRWARSFFRIGFGVGVCFGLVQEFLGNWGRDASLFGVLLAPLTCGVVVGCLLVCVGISIIVMCEASRSVPEHMDRVREAAEKAVDEEDHLYGLAGEQLYPGKPGSAEQSAPSPTSSPDGSLRDAITPKQEPPYDGFHQ
jgi:hypothetical protein